MRLLHNEASRRAYLDEMQKIAALYNPFQVAKIGAKAAQLGLAGHSTVGGAAAGGLGAGISAVGAALRGRQNPLLKGIKQPFAKPSAVRATLGTRIGRVGDVTSRSAGLLGSFDNFLS